MKILIRSRFPKRLNQIRSAGWLQTFHWIAFEIMPPPAESVSLDSNTCKSDSVEEDPSFEGDAYEFLDHVPLIYRTCLSSAQQGTCGPFTAQNVASSGCVNSSLSVFATPGLNGAKIRCINYDGSSYIPVATATISVIAAPQVPNISVISTGCTKIEVQWSMSSVSPNAGELTTRIVTVKMETNAIQSIDISSPWSASPLIFHNLVSDTLYTITYEASNCAGRNETVIKSWTLPSPPQDIHATHVINIIMQSMHLVVTWTSQLHADNNSYYILNVSSEDGLIFSVSQISMDHCENESSSCYFAQDFNDVTFAKYFVSMASVSGLRTGPFSAQVESLVITNPSIVTTTITCTFLDGQPYYCLVCCGSDQLSYPIMSVAGRGVVVSAAVTNLTSNHVYYCKASATVINNGTTCNEFNATSATVEFSFKTNQNIQAAVDSSIGAAVGVSVSVAFVVYFCMGVLAASVLCYISRKSKESSHKPSSCGDPATVYEVGTNKKMKEDVFELNTNNTYGSPTVQEVGTNKEMERDVLELNTNTAYGSPTVHEVDTNQTMKEDVLELNPSIAYGSYVSSTVHEPTSPYSYGQRMLEWSLCQSVETSTAQYQRKAPLTHVLRPVPLCDDSVKAAEVQRTEATNTPIEKDTTKVKETDTPTAVPMDEQTAAVSAANIDGHELAAVVTIDATIVAVADASAMLISEPKRSTCGPELTPHMTVYIY
ncbi:hypothetical protein EMCRGX_G015481 [Ephydatia muelleri]